MNIQGRQAFSKCVPWYSIVKKNTSRFWLILIHCVYLNCFMHVHCRRHIMYAINKQSIYVFHELGKLVKNIDIYTFVCMERMSHKYTMKKPLKK